FLVSRLDLVSLIDPALQPGYGLSQLAFDSVVIDPGHGGEDTGAISAIGSEKSYDLDIALRLKPLLEKEGINVTLTRTTDVFVPRPARVEIANGQPGAVFVSIHCNSGPAGES